MKRRQARLSARFPWERIPGICAELYTCSTSSSTTAMADSAPPAADALFGSGDGKPAEEAAASSLFDAGTATDGAQDIAGVFGSSADDPNDPFANVGLPNDTPGDVAGSVEGPASAVLEDYANQGWYDDDGKFHLYEDPNDTFNATCNLIYFIIFRWWS